MVVGTALVVKNVRCGNLNFGSAVDSKFQKLGCRDMSIYHNKISRDINTTELKLCRYTCASIMRMHSV